MDLIDEGQYDIWLRIEEWGSFLLGNLIKNGVVFEIRLSGKAIEGLDVLGVLGGSLDGKIVVDIFNLDWNKTMGTWGGQEQKGHEEGKSKGIHVKELEWIG